MARASLLHWLRWWCTEDWTFPSDDAAWQSAQFRYNKNPPPALPFIMDCQALGYDVVRTETGFAMAKIKGS